jgi:hypothetical protein
MGYTIDRSHPAYIKVTVTGVVDKETLLTAAKEILQHPEYIIKHTMWHFTEATPGLDIADLKEIVGIISLYKPEVKDFANKSALVLPGRLFRAMGDIFVTMAKLVPVKYMAFNDVEAAEDFLCSEKM